jgi:Cu/Ag efflux pump CusA
MVGHNQSLTVLICYQLEFELMSGVKIYGQSLDTINRLAQQFKKELEGIDGVKDLYVDPIVGGKYVDINIRKDEIGRYGLSPWMM